MTWKDKLEIGLKDDASFRRDNLPDFQKRKGGPETKPGDPTRSLARRTPGCRRGPPDRATEPTSEVSDHDPRNRTANQSRGAKAP
jgi:hypothetical protein